MNKLFHLMYKNTGIFVLWKFFFPKISMFITAPAFSPVNIAIETVITIQRHQKGLREFLRDNRQPRVFHRRKKKSSSSWPIFSENIVRICGNDPPFINIENVESAAESCYFIKLHD